MGPQSRDNRFGETLEATKSGNPRLTRSIAEAIPSAANARMFHGERLAQRGVPHPCPPAEWGTSISIPLVLGLGLTIVIVLVWRTATRLTTRPTCLSITIARPYGLTVSFSGWVGERLEAGSKPTPRIRRRVAHGHEESARTIASTSCWRIEDEHDCEHDDDCEYEHEHELDELLADRGRARAR
jgi:hypothetical protein